MGIVEMDKSLEYILNNMKFVYEKDKSLETIEVFIRASYEAGKYKVEQETEKELMLKIKELLETENEYL